jgi:hypothetical protein
LGLRHMTQQALSFEPPGILDARPVSPVRELGAYESLWAQSRMTVKRMADLFRANPDALPSDLVEPRAADEMGRRVVEMIAAAGVGRFGVRIHRAGEYPMKLRDAKHPVELLYYRGFWPLVETRCVAVVGTRKPTDDGIRRARKIALLVRDGFAGRGLDVRELLLQTEDTTPDHLSDQCGHRRLPQMSASES